MVNTSQQVGGSIGIAVLSTVAGAAVTPLDGFTTAFWFAAGIFAVGAVVVRVVLPPGRARHAAPGAEPVLAH
jgi:hypothetical protein